MCQLTVNIFIYINTCTLLHNRNDTHVHNDVIFYKLHICMQIDYKKKKKRSKRR